MYPPLEVNRLRWLCRRGMLELDAWLVDFLDTVYPTLPEVEQRLFGRMLERDDFQLFDWLTGHAPPPEEFSGLIERMQANGYSSKAKHT